jgi:hypothetical protein
MWVRAAMLAVWSSREGWLAGGRGDQPTKPQHLRTPARMDWRHASQVMPVFLIGGTSPN